MVSILDHTPPFSHEKGLVLDLDENFRLSRLSEESWLEEAEFCPNLLERKILGSVLKMLFKLEQSVSYKIL